MESSIVKGLGKDKFKEITRIFEKKMPNIQNLSQLEHDKKEVMEKMKVEVGEVNEIINLLLQRNVVQNSKEFTQKFN